MKLLEQLYKISSPSRKEEKMIYFITNWLQKRKIRFYVDKSGNIYATKGKATTYPCVVAHTDEVHKRKAGSDFKVLNFNDEILLGMDTNINDFSGIGADDKNGIWVCLKSLEEFEVIKCVFFVSEEIGCVGSSKADMKFFDNCRYVLQCDRKGNSDLITVANGVELCSSNFVSAIKPQKYGYKEASGMLTDVVTLKQRGLKVSCVNISCGYYNPHTPQEFTKMSDLYKCFKLVCHIIKVCNKTYRHKYKEPAPISRQSFGNTGNYPYRRSFCTGNNFDAFYDGYEDTGTSYRHVIEYDSAQLFMADLLSLDLNYPFSQLVDECKDCCDVKTLTRSDFKSIYEEIMGCPPPVEIVKPKKEISEKIGLTDHQTNVRQEAVPAFNQIKKQSKITTI